MYRHICVYTYAYMPVHIYIYIYIYIDVCVRVCVCLHVCECVSSISTVYFEIGTMPSNSLVINLSYILFTQPLRSGRTRHKVNF